MDECRDKPTSHCLTNFYTRGNNLIPISVLTHLRHKLAITDFSKETPFTVLAKQKCTNIVKKKKKKKKNMDKIGKLFLLVTLTKSGILVKYLAYSFVLTCVVL